MIYQGSKKYPVDTIAVHCSATQPGWMKDKTFKQRIAEVKRWHTDPPPDGRGWKREGYHWFIDRDGAVLPGRPMEMIGAGILGENNGVVHVCLFGGHGSTKNDEFSEHFTDEQDAALRRLIDEIKTKTTIKRLVGHNEFANKACPGFQVMPWFEGKKVKVRTNPVESTTVQASAISIASGAGAAVSGVAALDGTAQTIAIIFAGVVILSGMWIMRERLRRWAKGDR